MAASSYSLDNLANTAVVFTQAGATATGAQYKVTSRTLQLPETLTIDFKIGSTGSKGNDHAVIKISNTVADSNGVAATGSVTVDLSIPRNSGWTGTDSDDLLAFVQAFLTDARLANIADFIVP